MAIKVKEDSVHKLQEMQHSHNRLMREARRLTLQAEISLQELGDALDDVLKEHNSVGLVFSPDYTEIFTHEEAAKFKQSK